MMTRTHVTRLAVAGFLMTVFVRALVAQSPQETAMTGTITQSNAETRGSDAIRPFRVHVPEAALIDLLGISTNMSATVPPEIAQAMARGEAPPATLSADERRAWDQLDFFYDPKLLRYNRLPKGGHFAAWEQPGTFVTELRAGFQSLRSA